jgi:hypothetical protein
LTIEEPSWDLVLGRVLDDSDDSLEFFGGKFTSAVKCQFQLSPLQHNRKSSIPLVEIDIGLLAHQVGITTSDTLYLGQGVHDLSFVSIGKLEEGEPKTTFCFPSTLVLRSRRMYWKELFSPLKKMNY